MTTTVLNGPADPPVPAPRLAGAPISWGACEVPGWGEMPDPEQVLTEMQELGLLGTELGPPGFLPEDPPELSAMLARHDLVFVGSFVPLVLHEPSDAEAGRLTLRSWYAGAVAAASHFWYKPGFASGSGRTP